MPVKKPAPKKLDPRVQLPKPRTLTQWAADESRRSHLAELLLDPVMQDAFATLATVYNPTIPAVVAADGTTEVLDAENLNNLLALRHVHRSGFFGVRNALENLTRDKVLRRAESIPWGNLVADDE
jgi:hypothetical protein